MMFSDQCVFCQGKMFRKDEELLLRGGDNVATITVPADVCLRCGNQLLDSQTVRKIGEIEKKLGSGRPRIFNAGGNTSKWSIPACL